MASRTSSTENYFGTRPGSVAGTVPADATTFGFIIQNRTLQRTRDTVTGLRNHYIPFQYIEEVPPFSKAANYESIDISSRFENIIKYKNSNNIELSFKLIYYAEGSKERSHKTFWTIENTDKIIAKLESLVYPTYEVKYNGPDLVLLNIGSIYQNFPLRIKNVSTQRKSPFLIKNMKSIMTEVNIEATSSYPLYQSISSRDVQAYETERGIYAFKEFNSLNTR